MARAAATRPRIRSSVRVVTSMATHTFTSPFPSPDKSRRVRIARLIVPRAPGDAGPEGAGS